MDQLILSRIHDLLVYRRWIRTYRWAALRDLEREYRIELRALVKLAREARRLERMAPDPLSQYKSYSDWSQGELVEAFGR